MPSQRFLCLHGAGTSSEILQAQLGPLMRELEKDNSASFHFITGEASDIPGPGIEGFFEGPYYSYYSWPRRSSIPDNEVEHPVSDAYDYIYEVLEEEGPFDGVLGFSQGAALAYGFLNHHKSERPDEPLPFRQAVFFGGMPPFSFDDDENWVYDEGLEGTASSLATLHVAGKDDFVLRHSMKLHELCDQRGSSLVMHDRGHEIPTDPRTVQKVAAAFRALEGQSLMMA